MIEELKNIQTRALEEISGASVSHLEELRVKYLGRKSEFTSLMKNLSSLPQEQRPGAGKLVNEIKQEIAQALEDKKISASQAVTGPDITFPSSSIYFGTKHPISIIIDKVCSIFANLGFVISQGNEIEDEWFNFDALNVPLDHTSRDENDTFYLDMKKRENHAAGFKHLLRCHTSPVQIRTMTRQPPPLAVISPGRVYRPDSVDASHSFMFHQIEGFAVAQDIDFSNLKGVLLHFIKEMFGQEVELRFRPSYFPFTEPSAEVDMSCIICKGKGCSVCKKSGWLEVLGCGMIHPNIFKHCGIDHKKYRGFAFGMGVERFAMLKYGIDDIRLFYENDIRFLNQFYEV